MIGELDKTETKATKLARSCLLQATPRSLRELLLSAWMAMAGHSSHVSLHHLAFRASWAMHVVVQVDHCTLPAQMYCCNANAD